MKTSLLFTFLFLFLLSATFSQEDLKNPAFEEVLSLKSVGNPTISHNGQHVVFTMRRTDWENNKYDTELWLSKQSEDPFQLTRTKDGSSGNPQWSPDDKWIAFTANRGDKNQIYIINIEGGEAMAITQEKEGVQGYEWSPDGKSIVYTRLQDKPKEDKTREERYGGIRRR